MKTAWHVHYVHSNKTAFGIRAKLPAAAEAEAPRTGEAANSNSMISMHMK